MILNESLLIKIVALKLVNQSKFRSGRNPSRDRGLVITSWRRHAAKAPFTGGFVSGARFTHHIATT